MNRYEDSAYASRMIKNAIAQSKRLNLAECVVELNEVCLFEWNTGKNENQRFDKVILPIEEAKRMNRDIFDTWVAKNAKFVIRDDDKENIKSINSKS